MAKFGKKSLACLDTLHPQLKMIYRIAIKIVDFSIIEGHRSNERQQELYLAGKSQSASGQSKHNLMPSWAGDAIPHPVEWPDEENDSKREYARKMGRFYYLAGVLKAVAYFVRVKIKWGGTFSKFFDGPHTELVEE